MDIRKRRLHYNDAIWKLVHFRSGERGDSVSTLAVALYINTFGILRSSLSYKFTQRISKSTNLLVITIVNCHC
jgi:hypothetical protein